MNHCISNVCFQIVLRGCSWWDYDRFLIEFKWLELLMQHSFIAENKCIEYIWNIKMKCYSNDRFHLLHCHCILFKICYFMDRYRSQMIWKVRINFFRTKISEAKCDYFRWSIFVMATEFQTLEFNCFKFERSNSIRSCHLNSIKNPSKCNQPQPQPRIALPKQTSTNDFIFKNNAF